MPMRPHLTPVEKAEMSFFSKMSAKGHDICTAITTIFPLYACLMVVTG